MKNVKVSELRNHLGRLLAYVRRGGTVRVFDRGTPIADLTPCATVASDATTDAALAELERAGVVRRATRKLPKDFVTRKLLAAQASVTEALLDERRADR